MVPITRILEDIICRRYYDLPHEIDEKLCKIDVIQSQLAYINGTLSTLEAAVGLFFAFPYGILADRIGRKPIFVLASLGSILTLTWAVMVLRFSQTIPVYFILVAPVFRLIGGGNSVLIVVIYSIVADVESEANRASSFFLVAIGSLTGGLLGPVVSSKLMEIGSPWGPILLVFIITLLATSLIIFIPETLQIDENGNSHLQDQTIHSVIKFYVQQTFIKAKESISILKYFSLVIILLTFLIQMPIALATSQFFIQYISKRFDWPLSKTGYLLAVQAVVNIFLILVVLPGLSKLLLSSFFNFTASRKGLILAQFSALFIIVGSLLLAGSNITIVVFGIIIITFGTGLAPLCRSLITNFIDPQHTSRLYTLIGIVEALGSLFTGPVLAWSFSAGMRMAAQQLKDLTVQSRIHHQRDLFIAQICEDDVCHLASSHHNGQPRTFFKPPIRGSYNVCCFVQFSPDPATVTSGRECLRDGRGDRWVVRVPLAPCLAWGGKDKLESEIATMQLIANNTIIPLPKIHAYSLDSSPEPLSSYLILEYIDGERLSYQHLGKLSNEQKDNLYTSLADIYLQLRRLEFPSIGRLTRHQDKFEVRKRITTIDINVQELEGLQPSRVQDSFYGEKGVLNCADDYIEMLLQIADNAFTEGRSTVWEKSQGEDALYHHYIFRSYAQNWADRDHDRGPFVLVHGDLEPFNLMVNEDMTIISVLDWEWSRVVPRQFFKPPLWLKIPDTTKLAWEFVYQDYLKEFDRFQSILKRREHERYGNDLLFNEWELGKLNSGFLVVNALENWTDMDWFANRYINRKCYGGSTDLDQRVRAFMEADPARQALIEKKVLQSIAYDAEVGQLKNDGSPVEHKISNNVEVTLGSKNISTPSIAILSHT
ncbi:hypothetical protein B7463_g6868, partial [Scytalidium lignicola]